MFNLKYILKKEKTTSITSELLTYNDWIKKDIYWKKIGIGIYPFKVLSS